MEESQAFGKGDLDILLLLFSNHLNFFHFIK